VVTTIQVDNDLKARLDSLKIHNRETYNELLLRLVEMCSGKSFDNESLIETISVLSSPETMRNIAEALEDINDESKWISLEQVKKENGL